MVRNADSCYLKSHCLSQNTSAKVQTQSSTAKKSKPKESKLKDSKPANRKTFALPHTNESGKTFCQNKKKEYLKKKQNKKNFIPATGNNIIEGEKK